MVPGVLIALGTDGGGAYRFVLMPSVKLSALKAQRDEVEEVRKLLKAGTWPDLSDAELDKIVALTHAALARNHPTLSAETWWELLDITTASEVLAAFFGHGKFIKPGPGETPGADGFLTYGATGQPEEDDGFLHVNPLMTSPLQA